MLETRLRVERSSSSLNLDADVTGKKIGEAGVVVLARVLPQCTALTKLNLYRTQIGDSGCVALSNVLPQCPALSYLSLESNQIGDSGGVALSNVLPQCPALSELNLDDNPIGPSVRSKLDEMSRTVQNRNGNTIRIDT